MATSHRRVPPEIHPQHHSFKLACIALAATSTPAMTHNISANTLTKAIAYFRQQYPRKIHKALYHTTHQPPYLNTTPTKFPVTSPSQDPCARHSTCLISTTITTTNAPPTRHTLLSTSNKSPFAKQRPHNNPHKSSSLRAPKYPNKHLPTTKNMATTIRPNSLHKATYATTKMPKTHT